MNPKQIIITEIWYTNRHSMKCSKFCSETISKGSTCSNYVYTRGLENARTLKSNTSIAFKNHTVSKRYYTNTTNHVETH